MYSGLENLLCKRLMLFKKHGLLLGINWIFKDLSPSLVSLHPLEVKQTWQVSFVCLLSDGHWKQQKACVCIFILSVLKSHQPNQFKIHLVKKKKCWGFFNNHIFGCASSKCKLSSQFINPAISVFLREAITHSEYTHTAHCYITNFLNINYSETLGQ